MPGAHMPQAQAPELQRRKLHNGDKLAPLSRFVTVARAAAPAEPDGNEAAAPHRLRRHRVNLHPLVGLGN